jgi:hypothetical protein
MRNRLLTATSFILAGSGMLHAQNYFPLAVGNRWEYIDEGQKRRVIVEVTGVDEVDHKKWFKVRWLDGQEHRLRLDGQGTLVELDFSGGQDVVWVKFAAPPIWKYESKFGRARVKTRDANGIEIVYDPVCCDRGILSEVYADSVGLKERVSDTFGGPKRLTLVSARIAGRKLSF